MKNRYTVTLGTAVAAALVWSTTSVPVRAEDSATQPTNPGFVPNIRQINPGAAQQLSSQPTDLANIPTPEEARAALMAPISRQPSTGDASAATTGSAAQSPQGLQDAQLTNPAGASGEPPPSGPIGSFGQTIPAKFSKRNDTLDHVPIMAIPLPLTDEQRKQIYDAVMADNSRPVAGADALKPSSELSPHQALNGMKPLPEGVRGIDGVSQLYYLKAKGKVLLIEPATRTVVGQITSE
ncbi:MAG TPA: hypothetical protein VEH78_06695 [Pseudolabrys sp.]|nr:hypothetical protein [Pseudolabrys sp.]